MWKIAFGVALGLVLGVTVIFLVTAIVAGSVVEEQQIRQQQALDQFTLNLNKPVVSISRILAQRQQSNLAISRSQSMPKPDACFSLKDNGVRALCLNEVIKARAAYLSSNH